jgi:hypothetical protein
MRLAAAEAGLAAVKEQVSSIFQGETFFFKKLQWFGTVVLAIFALGSIFTYIVNTTKINDSVEMANKKWQIRLQVPMINSRCLLPIIKLNFKCYKVIPRGNWMKFQAKRKYRLRRLQASMVGQTLWSQNFPCHLSGLELCWYTRKN